LPIHVYSDTLRKKKTLTNYCFARASHLLVYEMTIIYEEHRNNKEREKQKKREEEKRLACRLLFIVNISTNHSIIVNIS